MIDGRSLKTTAGGRTPFGLLLNAAARRIVDNWGRGLNRFISDVFSGVGIGLLLGTVLGLSTTPVVALVVGALTSILAVFLGLDGKENSRLPSVSSVRIGAFGLATVAGLGLGLHLRINNPIAIAPSVAMERWIEAFPDNPTLARQMMIYERTAIVPGALQFEAEAPGTAVALDAAAASVRQAVLFSSLSEFDACTRLDPERFATADDVIAAYSRPGAPDTVKALAADLAALPDGDKPTAVIVAHSLLCTLQLEESK